MRVIEENEISVSTLQATAVTSAALDIRHMLGYSAYIAWTDTTPSAVEFEDSDVATGTEYITDVGHGLFTGLKGQLTTTGTLPTGLATSTDYWVIKIDDDTFQLASSLANAQAGTAVDITAASGGGTHTFTPTAIAGTIKLQYSIDLENWEDVADSSQTISGTNSAYVRKSDVFDLYLRLHGLLTAGQATVVFKLGAKGA